MSAFMDLNITATADKHSLKTLIQTAAHLGYSTVAINHVFEPQPRQKKLKQELPKPTCLSELFDELPIIQGKSRPIRVLNRLTLKASDPGHFKNSAPEYRGFDLLAVHPSSEKLFHAACMEYCVDIVCVTVTEKLPFFFKRPSVNGAIDRGVVFEITYSEAIRDSTMRRYTICNSVCLNDKCHGKNIIISSGAKEPMDLRGPYDITNLGLLFGLSESDAKDAVSATCRSVLMHAETRKAASGIVYTVESPLEKTTKQHGGTPLKTTKQHGDTPLKTTKQHGDTPLKTTKQHGDTPLKTTKQHGDETTSPSEVAEAPPAAKKPKLQDAEPLSGAQDE